MALVYQIWATPVGQFLYNSPIPKLLSKDGIVRREYALENHGDPNMGLLAPRAPSKVDGDTFAVFHDTDHAKY